MLAFWFLTVQGAVTCQSSGTCYAAYPFADSYAYPSIDLRETMEEANLKICTSATGDSFPSWASAMATAAEFSIIRTQYAQRMHNTNWVLNSGETLCLSRK